MANAKKPGKKKPNPTAAEMLWEEQLRKEAATGNVFDSLRGRYTSSTKTTTTVEPLSKRGRGRPVKWDNAHEMEDAGLAYFDLCDATEKPYTIGGLSLALNLSYQGLNEYEDKAEFSATVKRLKTRILQFAEEHFYSGAPAGAIFHAKNLGMSDKQEVKQSGEVTTRVVEFRLPVKRDEL